MTSGEEIVSRLTGPGAQFEIRTEEVLGERMAVFANRHRSLGEVLLASRRFGDREYLVTEQRRLTFTEHADEVAALARAARRVRRAQRRPGRVVCRKPS